MNFFKTITLFFSGVYFGQSIENSSSLDLFKSKLQNQQQVVSVLFLGDSHIQAGYISEVLRKNFQNIYGNAGRGTVFPYAVANSSGNNDVESVSNKAWQTFRSVYDQDYFPQVGALGFVMGNNEDSLLEILMKNPEDTFDKVLIFNDAKMDGESFSVFQSDSSLKNYVQIKKIPSTYTIQAGDTFPELAAKFNIITTRLIQLNGNTVAQAIPGQTIKVEKAEPVYNRDFESKMKKIGAGTFNQSISEFRFDKPTTQLLMETNAKNGNLLYGFQFLNSKATKGLVFNTVGINGATYADFRKYSLQLEQLTAIHPDLVMISLGTNEALSSITKEVFLKNVADLVGEFRKTNPNFPILLISPTDNLLNPKKTAAIISWIAEAAKNLNVAYLDLYKATGGAGYFRKSLLEKKANADKVHFLEAGYQDQGKLIWKAIEESILTKK